MEPIYAKDLEYGSWPYEKNDYMEYYYQEEIEDEYYTGYGKIINDYDEYEGEFKDGLYDGKGKLDRGYISFEGFFEKGRFIRGKVNNYVYKHFYEGEYDDLADEYSGFGRIVHGDGEIGFGEFKNGALNGIGVTIYTDGITSVGLHKDGSSTFQKNKIVLSSLKSHFLFINIKGNGLPITGAWHTNSEDWPNIIQIGWVLFEEDGTEITRSERIIKPEGFTISRSAELLHGISHQEALINGVCIRSVIKELELITSKTLYIGGHDVKFIKGMVVSETIRNHLHPIFNGKQYICTANGVLKNEKYKDLKLSQLYKKLGYRFDETQSALTNAIASGEFYWTIKKKFKEEISSTSN